MSVNYFIEKLIVMSKKDRDNVNSQKGTNRDVRPQQGQQSNENWDDNNDSRSSGTGSNARNIDEDLNTTGVGSSQRNKQDSVGPLDSDLEQLPSEKRKDRGSNLTGPGIG